MAKGIEVIIGPDGSVKVEAVGYNGRGCVEATAEIEKALGKVTSDQKKPEFGKVEKQGEGNRQAAW